MVDVETTPQTYNIEDTDDFVEVDGPSPETHDEHEAAGVVEPDPVLQDDTPADGAVHDDAINPVITQEDTQPEDTPTDAAPSSTKPEVTKKLNSKAVVTAGKDKLVISAKAKGAPTKSGPPTPTVKKVRLPHLSLM